MRLIFLLMDSLNRSALGAYGGDIETPNFDRLAAHAVTFDRHYVGSLPCIPARRDIQTGRANFFHRSWGPMEPYDESVCQLLRQAGIYSHLVTDHFHYFQNGGGGYHTQYDSWDFIRGQEYDIWKAIVEPPLDRFASQYDQRHYDVKKKKMRVQHMVNRLFEEDEADFPTPRCFASAFEFLQANKNADNWMLQLELFDPHEPFHAPKRFRRDGDSTWKGGVLNWPDYVPVTETEEEITEIRASYAAQIRMLDEYLGRLLDFMDMNEMWKDTAIIMSTDHGFLLGEHSWWGKSRMPYYEEMSHIPLMVYHPGHADAGGQRSSALTQTIDLMPTILDIFGVDASRHVTGRSLLPLMDNKLEEERIVAFGLFAGPIGVTDGRYVMLHYPPDVLGEGLFEYTLMPQHMVRPFTPSELATASLSAPFDFTRGTPLLRIEATRDAARPPNLGGSFMEQGFKLFDLQGDPGQDRPIRDAEIEARLYLGLKAYMAKHDVPDEAYVWQGISR